MSFNDAHAAFQPRHQPAGAFIAGLPCRRRHRLAAPASEYDGDLSQIVREIDPFAP